MGKRKERRLAAMSAAGRRVKLDLFAEPSGDLGGSSAQYEVGGDDESKNHAEFPNSPTSSGQQPENPLLLLGQYSDDEVDEESSKEATHAIVENFLADLDEQTAAGKDTEDIEANAGQDVALHKVEQNDMENGSVSLDGLQKIGVNGNKENDAAASGDLYREMDSTEPISVPATSDIQVGDASLGWKMVLHEESNQYYYWNTFTGETSWETPDVLARESKLTREQETAADAEGIENATVGECKSSSTLDVELDDATATQPCDGSKGDNPNCEIKQIYEHRPEMEVLSEGYKVEGNVLCDIEGGDAVNQSDVKNTSSAVGTLHPKTSSPGDNVSSGQSGGVLFSDGVVLNADSRKYIPDTGDFGEHESGTDLSSYLMKHGEYLLEKLKSLKGSKGHLPGHDCISKYILEVEIRLSDMTSLLSYGSSLLPFWVYSERRLKQLEAVINNEVLKFYKDAQMSEVETTPKSQESIGDGVKADANEKKKAVCSNSEDSHASDHVSIITDVQKNSCDEAYNNVAVNAEHVPSIGFTSDSGAVEKGETSGVVIATESTSNPFLHSGEDVDMDVDMEVEDANPASNAIIGDASDAEYHALPGQPIPPILPAEHEGFAPVEGFGVPPSPDEDWIPPPPPDNELLPPPPPDEPPEPSYPPPPSDLETVRPFSYTEPYNLLYPGSNFGYYGQTHTEVPGSNFYAHAEGCQMPVPYSSLYYEAVPNMYPGADPVVVNPVQPVAYYGCQDVTVPPVPVVSGIESSGNDSESGHQNFGSDLIGLIEAHAEVHGTSIPNTEVEDSAIGQETEKTSVEVPFAPASFQAPATSSATESVPVASSSAVPPMAINATETVPKVQSKVSRNKKRTVATVSTLRSNKKVSSLVDKWKAAKEELHEEEEDEPENAYEMLEKKRQREIKEWHAQQIASGGAKVNANFQPLRGDWREKVKRKRAQLMTEAVQTPSESVTNGNQLPDLNELSRDLPSGWQAYWDESSKQVYYGKTSTSETTWIRPTI